MTATFSWTGAEVRRALGLNGGADAPVEFAGIATDSRKVRPGDLFVALVGPAFDGHDFVDAAVAAGAGGAVVAANRAVTARSIPHFTVDDTLTALGRLAAHRRRSLTVPVVGITGSSGKTSTKDFMRGALGTALTVHATTGNLNNRIGLPMTLLATPAGTDVVVLEMGTSEPGEIRTLTEIACPTAGVVTTVGESHLEGLGSVEGVLEEKLELLRGLSEEGWAVVGDTPAMLPEGARLAHDGVRVAGWTDRADPDLRPVHVEFDAQGRHHFAWRGAPVELGVPGRHMVQNALLALAVAERLGVEPASAAAGVSAVQPGWMRGQVERAGGLTLLLDCYNANPQSVRAALEVLELHAGRKVAVLGSMLELGSRADALHADVLRDALTRDLDVVLATGAFARAVETLEDLPGRPAVVVAVDPVAGYRQLRPLLEGDEVVLLKGSRGVALEGLLPLLREDFGGDAAPAGGGH